jgi:hypothetical protein
MSQIKKKKIKNIITEYTHNKNKKKEQNKTKKNDQNKTKI